LLRPRTGALRYVSACVLAALVGLPLRGAGEGETTSRYEYREQHSRDGIGKFYMGREIAIVMGHQAADWLDRPEREAEEAPSLLLKLLKIKPGMTICDLGAGSGYLTFPMAKMVGPKGKVYAVDIDSGFFPFIQAKAKDAGVANVQTVLGQPTDPRLPASDVDVAFFHDVLHHIENRAEYLKAVASYTKPTGRIAIIELPPTGSHKDEPALVVTKDQVRGWLADAGFKPVQEFDGLAEGKWFV